MGYRKKEVDNENMKEYVIETLNKSKGNAYIKFKNNSDLVNMLDTKYPHISDFVIKIQLYIRDMNDIPDCENTNCNNKIKYTASKFTPFCSRKCLLEHKKKSGFYEELAKNNSEKSKNRSPEEKLKILEKRKQTNRKKFGSDYYFESAEAKNTIIKNNIEKYGTPDPVKMAWQQYNTGIIEGKDLRYIVEKLFETNMKKHGSKTFMETKDFRNKSKETMVETYGTEYYVLTDEFKDKTTQTNLEKYGVINYSQTDEYKEKVKQTNLEKYGVESYSQTDEFKEKYKDVMMEKYGVEYYSQTDEYNDKVKKTSLEKYGVEHYSQTDESKERIKQTIMKKYGVEHHMFRDETKEKIKQTNLEKYGVEHHGKLNYNPDYLDTFNNPDKFKELLYEHGTYGLADLVNCDTTTIYKYAIDNNIPLPPRPNSYQEEIVHEFLENNNIPHSMNTKKILPSGLELDFYLPEHNLAIEINGLYYHSEKSGGKSRSYHYNKWKECNDLGITLLSINEDEFYDRQQFWFNKILYMTGKLSLTKLHARKCKVVELDNVSDFLNEHHLQGSNASKYKFGLTYEDQLVSVMTFSKPRGNQIGTIDLSRFCNHSGYMVSGGASKLLSHFVKTYGHLYKEIISFSDNNYSNGNVYKSLGLNLDKNLPPDYKYIIKGKTYHKAGFRKSAIFRKNDIPSDMMNSPEWELMQYLGYDRIWDTGKKKWIMKISS
jgi:hypothetical protein